MKSIDTIPKSTISFEIVSFLRGECETLNPQSLHSLVPSILVREVGIDNIKVVLRASTKAGYLSYVVAGKDTVPGSEHMEQQTSAIDDWRRLLLNDTDSSDGYRLGRTAAPYFNPGKGLEATDRVLMNVSIHMKANGSTLFVDFFDTVTGQRVATDFYLNILPELARNTGARFIVGENDNRNIGFYLKKIGRVLATNITEEGIIEIGIHAASHTTVQFLYSEDKEKYTKVVDG